MTKVNLDEMKIRSVRISENQLDLMGRPTTTEIRTRALEYPKLESDNKAMARRIAQLEKENAKLTAQIVDSVPVDNADSIAVTTYMVSRLEKKEKQVDTLTLDASIANMEKRAAESEYSNLRTLTSQYHTVVKTIFPDADELLAILEKPRKVKSDEAKVISLLGDIKSTHEVAKSTFVKMGEMAERHGLD